MADVQLKFYVRTTSEDTNVVSESHNSDKPEWGDGAVGDNRDTSPWWKTDNDNVDYAYSVVDNTVYAQYGFDRPKWATARFIRERVDIASQEVNKDGSIHVEADVQVIFYKTRRTNFFRAGVPVLAESDINGQVLPNLTNSGDTGVEQTVLEPEIPKVRVSADIAPEQESNATTLHIKTHYPTGLYDDNEIWVGLSLFNPNAAPPPEYVPMALRRGEWKALNENNGFIKRRQGGNWNDFSKEQIPTARQPDQGHNRIRKNGQWLQLPPMSGGNAV